MRRKRRRRWTREEKSDNGHRYKESGLGLHAFAKKAGSRSSSLYRWFGKNGTVPTSTASRSVVPVRRTTATFDPEHDHPLEVVLPNGRSIRVLGEFAEEVLQRC